MLRDVGAQNSRGAVDRESGLIRCPAESLVVVRYRFHEFTLSPQRRLLVRGGQEVPLIPRYFDLLLLLIERRREAVHRREIFDRVWTDVIVSESALSQAVRTIRRALDDDPRDPRYIRTVSRHGYQFVFPDVIEEADDAAAPEASRAALSGATVEASALELPKEVPERDESRLRYAARLAAKQWPGAAAGGAIAGIAAGGLGGLILAASPGSTAPVAIAPVLAVVAGVAGAAGGAGVGAGLAFADGAARSHRTLALTAGAALGGGLVGLGVQWLARWGMAEILGLDLEIGGGLEGVLIGGCAGLGYTLGTRTEEGSVEGMDGRGRLRAALVTAAACGLAGLAITLLGRPLAGGTIHAIADAAEGSRATLAPLGRLIGEADFGPVSRVIAGVGECALFGVGLTFGLLRPSRSKLTE